MRGVPGVWVVLHRVATDSAGPLDSARAGADGAYRFRYRPSGSEDAVYFVSATYDGIAYFTQPLRARDVTGDDAEITVFDTTSGPLPLHVRGRHLVVSAPRADDTLAGAREVVEVYELSNDSSLTLVSPDDARPTWTATLPEGASAFRAGQGDVSASAVRFANGRVAVVAPFAPGVKQVSFSYRLAPARFPLSIPLDGGAGIFEVLLEDPGAAVSGARLQPVAPVSVEGHTFQRFLAHDVPPNAVAHVSVPALAPARTRRVAGVVMSTEALYIATIALAIGVAMLVALARTFSRRPAALPAHQVMRGPLPANPPPPSVESLAREIADLDRDFEARSSPGAAERTAYESARGELKRRLARALAEHRARG
jgi:hypothetical protein